MEQSPARGAQDATSQVQGEVDPAGHGTPTLCWQVSPDPAQQFESDVQGCETLEQVEGFSQIPSLQKSPVAQSQQSVSRPQDCPVAEQVVPPDLQVPEVAPGGTSQVSPEQQSAVTVQAPASGTHGVRQTPPSQVPEQHWPPVVQAFPFGAQRAQVPLVAPGRTVQRPEQQSAAATSHALPDDLQVGGGGVTTSVQTKNPASTTSLQESSSQQVVSEAPAQRVPRGLQVLPVAEQRSTPAASGTQGENPQHWSRNWQTSPAGMQQSGFAASQPVGQEVVWPPKQRRIPFASGLQTSFFPLQQFCDAFTSVEAPQMFPGGLQPPPLSQV